MPTDSSARRLTPAIARLLAAALLAGALWSWLAVGRVGPRLIDQGIETPAEHGSQLLQNLADRHLYQRAVDGRIHLMPFQPLQWSDETEPGPRITRMEAEVFVPGLTHVDVVFEDAWPDQAVFRLSRVPNLPSHVVRRQWEHQVDLHFVDDRAWKVSEDVISPERRHRLTQADNRDAAAMFSTIEEAFEGRWFTIAVDREGDFFRVSVDGEEVIAVTLEEMPRGHWGLAGGALPSVHVRRWACAGERFEAGEWQPLDVAIDLTTPSLMTGSRLLDAWVLSVAAAILCLLLALIGWAVAPGRRFAEWLRLSPTWLVPALVFLAWDLLRGNPPHEHHLVARGWWVLALAFAVLAIQIIVARRDWRWRPSEMQRVAPSRWVRAWLVAGLVLIVVIPMAGLLLSRFALPSGPVPDVRMPLRWLRDRPMQRGDVISTLGQRGGEALGDLQANLTVRALDEPTTIEILVRLAHHEVNTIRHWHAVRLSTVPGGSEHFASHNHREPVPIDWTLPANATTEITVEVSDNLVTLRSGGETITGYREDHLDHGGIGLLVREGRIALGPLRVSGQLLNTQKVPGIATGQERWAVGWVLGPPMALWLLLPLLAWLLARWWGVPTGFTRPWLAGLAALLTVVWIGFAWHWAREEQPSGPAIPVFVIGLVGGIACLGLYIPLAAHGRQMRRRTLSLLLLLVGMIGGAELALRGTTLGDALRQDFQGGRYTDQFLVRPDMAQVVWLAASGQFQGRVYRPLPRVGEEGPPRVFSMGGSSTYGSGVVQDEFTWPWLLEESLGDRRGIEAEIFNHGYPGFTALDALCFLRAGLVDLEPDWVMLSVTGNDALAPEGNPPPQRERFDAAVHGGGPSSLLRHSRLVVLLNQWLMKVTTSPEERFLVPRSTPEDFRQTIEEIWALGQERGFGLILVAEPIWERVVFEESYYQPWVDAMRAFAEERGIPFIDPVPAYRHQLPANCWATHIHPTWRGNQLMSEVLAPTVAAALSPEGAR